MSWYMAVLVRGAHVNGKLDPERLGDMQYRLVRADDADAAYQRALELGRDAEDPWTDEDGTEVTLKFLGLADLLEIGDDDPGDGDEVYSQLLPSRPAEMVAAKEELTVFEPEDDLLDGDEDEEEEDEG